MECAVPVSATSFGFMCLFFEMSRKERVVLMRLIKPGFPAVALLFEAVACRLFHHRLECPTLSSIRSS